MHIEKKRKNGKKDNRLGGFTPGVTPILEGGRELSCN